MNHVPVWIANVIHASAKMEHVALQKPVRAPGATGVLSSVSRSQLVLS